MEEELKQGTSESAIEKQANEWAKEEQLYEKKDFLWGFRQVIVDAGLGHLLEKEDKVEEMEMDPVVGVDAPDGACATGMSRGHCEKAEPYSSPTSSGSKRKRSDLEQQQQQQEAEEADTDSCKRSKPLDDCKSLDVLLGYLKQSGRETVVCEAQKWARKRDEAVAELLKANADFSNVLEKGEARFRYVQDDYDHVTREIEKLYGILEAHGLHRLVENTYSNMYDAYFYNDSESGSVCLGKVVDKKEEDGEEEVVSTRAVALGEEQKDVEEGHRNAGLNDEENAAPSQKAAGLTTRMVMAPFYNAQRVLKDYNRRFQMRERRGETRW